METDDFQLPSARRQLKRKGSRNSSSKSDRGKRSGTKPAIAGESQPVKPVPNHPKAKDARVPPVILREKARWMAVNAELSQQGVRTTKLVNTNVGIRIQLASAADYRQLVRIVFKLKMQYHSYHLTEEKPLKVVIRGVSEEITEDEVAGAARRPTPLIFVQLTKSGEAKKIISVSHVCGMNVTVESKRVNKDQVIQCHRCQLYGHGQRNRHAAAVCVKFAGWHQTAEYTKPRDVPAKCALCSARTPPATENARSLPTTTVGKSQPPKEAPTAMETDAPTPSTSTVKPSYAAAVKKSAAKIVARKPKASGKPKTPATTTRGAVILAGDLNPKHPSWNLRQTNASGICLRRFADDLHLPVDATAEPTIFPHNKQPDVLDIVLSSDHNPVLLLLGQAAPEDEEPWTHQTVSWPAFVDHLSANIGPITAIGGPIELETAVRQVTERVSDSVRYATNTSRAVDVRAFIPTEVRDLIREKNRLRRQWQGTLNPASKAEYNGMARRTKVALDGFRNNRWGDFMVRAWETPSEFWKAVKVMKRQRVPVPPIHGARGAAFTIEDKAEAFAETLDGQCSPVYENVDVDRIGRILRQVRDLLTAEEDEEPIQPTSPEEVTAIVKSFRPNKAPGPDGITYRVLKHAPQEVRHAYDQHMQRHATPAPLPIPMEASGRSDNTEARTVPQLAAILPAHQSFPEHIKEGFNRRECTGAVFLEVAKAFGKVWHQVHSLLSPQEDLQSQAGSAAVHSEDGHSRRAARVSDLTPAVQHLHQRHPDNRARQPGDVRGRCLHLFKGPQCQSDRPTSPDSTLHFAGLIRKVENRRPSPENHGRAFRVRRSPKKEVRQRARTHLPRRHHSLATRSPILGSYARFPGKLGSPHTPRSRPRTSDVGNPLSDYGKTREARSLA
ncbi:hypothetical protein Trydic_g16449 [Trypoxylus dichotomus]